MRFEISNIRKMMNDKIKEYNKEYNQSINLIDFKIEYSNRMTRCAGMYVFSRNKYRTPISFKFSKNLFDTLTDDFKKEVVLHELAHYIATEQYKVDCNHDKRWKNICLKIGMKNNDTRYEVAKEDFKRFRYNVYCPTCGEVIHYYNRLTDKTKQNYKNHKMLCRKCETRELQIIDNKLGKTIIK